MVVKYFKTKVCAYYLLYMLPNVLDKSIPADELSVFWLSKKELTSWTERELASSVPYLNNRPCLKLRGEVWWARVRDCTYTGLHAIYSWYGVSLLTDELVGKLVWCVLHALIDSHVMLLACIIHSITITICKTVWQIRISWHTVLLI